MHALPSSEQYVFSTEWIDNYDHSSELARGQSKCMQIFNPIGCNYNVVNVRTRNTHNKYTMPPTLSTRFVGKPEGGQQCIFDLFWLFFRGGGGNTNLGGRGTRGRLDPPNPHHIPDKSSTAYARTSYGRRAGIQSNNSNLQGTSCFSGCLAI